MSNATYVHFVSMISNGKFKTCFIYVKSIYNAAPSYMGTCPQNALVYMLIAVMHVEMLNMLIKAF